MKTRRGKNNNNNNILAKTKSVEGEGEEKKATRYMCNKIELHRIQSMNTENRFLHLSWQ